MDLGTGVADVIGKAGSIGSIVGSDVTIKANSQTIISAAEEFRNTNNQIKTITTNMLEMIRALGTSWMGDAATGYSTKFNKLSEDMDKMYRMINEHVNDLSQIARNYDSGEETNLGTSDALPTNAIG